MYAVDLRKRIYDYFSESYYKKSENTIIIRAINKYGLEHFELAILEIKDSFKKEDLISREQFFIDSLEPEYNILKKAGNTLGYKHTESTKAKLSEAAFGRIHSLETIARISEALKNNKNNQGCPLTIKDLVSNITTEYKTMTEAARELGFSHSTISMGLKKNGETPFKLKGRYLVTINRP